MKNQDLFITGAGMITAAGVNLPENWQSLRNGTQFLRRENEIHVARLGTEAEAMISSFRRDKYLEPLDRSTLMALVATDEAVRNAGASPDELREALVLMGNSRGPASLLEEQYRKFFQDQKMNPFIGVYTQQGSLCGAVSRQIGSKSISMTISSACISAIHGIGVASALLANGQGTMALVGGAESALSPFLFTQIAPGGVLAKSQDGFACRPMDPHREGTAMGEGAACFVVETNPSRRPLAKINGYSAAIESGLLAGSSENGESLQQAIGKALKQAGMDFGDIDLIVGHGAGTKVGDSAEMNSYHELFGDRLPMLSLHKWCFGHLFGAAAAASLAMACKIIENRFVPRHPYLKETESILGKEFNRDIKTVLITSMGVGGMAGALIISKV